MTPNFTRKKWPRPCPAFAARALPEDPLGGSLVAARAGWLVAAAGLVLLLFPLALARAQQPAALRADIVGVKDGEYPHAQAVVNTDDTSGEDVTGLTASNFSATIDGAPAAIVSAELASSQNLPLDLLFVIDTSGSMAGAPLARTKEAATGFLSGLAPADRVAVVRFADDVQLVQDYSTDRAQTSAAIDGLTASGNTALYQATANTAIKVNLSTASRRAVIFLSDGAQDGVPLTVPRDVALSAAAGIGVPFFTIGEGKAIDREYLQQLAGATRGRYLEAPDPKDLTALYANVARMLRSQYIVTFDASAASEAGSELAITLQTATSSATGKATYKPAAGFAPAGVTIEGLAPGDSVRDTRTITISSAAAGAGVRASFYVDGVNVFESVDPPYSYHFDPRHFGDGDHTLRVSLQSVAGKASDASVGFSSVAPPPAAEGGGGGSALPIAAGVGIGLLLAIGAFVALRVRAAGRADAPDLDRVVSIGKPMLTRGVPSPEVPEEEMLPVESTGEPLGLLISRAGNDLGTEYNVGGSPVSIGSGPRCVVRVADAEIAGEEARIWVRKGQLMVHKMTRLTALVADGTLGGWQILEPGDKFQVGNHTFEFRLLASGEPSADPNVLRSDGEGGPPRPDQRSSNFSSLMPRSE